MEVNGKNMEYAALREFMTVKLLRTIAERDAALLERNTALVSRRAAMAERDAVIMQRDMVVVKRDSAIAERDAAVAALEIAAAGGRGCLWNWDAGRPYLLSEGCSPFLAPPLPNHFSAGRCMAQQPWDRDIPVEDPGPLWKKPKAEALDMVTATDMDGQSHLQDIVRVVPCCSCTGVKRQCYRWGNGGWQSSCCTTSFSLYPLPMNPKRKGYRMPGRKMTTGAFQKLCERLLVADEGKDPSQAVDLKDYWGKHSNNRRKNESLEAEKTIEMGFLPNGQSSHIHKFIELGGMHNTTM